MTRDVSRTGYKRVLLKLGGEMFGGVPSAWILMWFTGWPGRLPRWYVPVPRLRW